MPLRPSIFLFTFLSLYALGTPLRAQNQAPEAPIAVTNTAPVETQKKRNDDDDDDDDAPKRERERDRDRDRERDQERERQRDQDRERRQQNEMRQQSEMRLRAMMSDLGLEDAVKQDAVVAFLSEDVAGRNKVLGAARRLEVALRRGAEPKRVRDLIAVYKATLDADRERRRAAQTALDAKLGFTLDPRVEAALWLFGVLGDGQLANPLDRPLGRAASNGNGNRNGNGGGNGGGGNGGRARGNGNGGNGGERGPKDAEEVRGTVERKGEGWIEVRDEQGTLERFFTFWTNPAGGAENGFDRDVVEAIRTIAVGAPVRLNWVWNERKRVVHIAAWNPLPQTAATTAPPKNAPDKPENGPKNPPAKPADGREPQPVTQPVPQPATEPR